MTIFLKGHLKKCMDQFHLLNVFKEIQLLYHF